MTTAQMTTVQNPLFPEERLEGEPLEIPLAEIRTPPVRTPPSRELVESVRRFGVLVPVAVIPGSRGYVLVDGLRRVAAARAAGLETVPARVYEGSAVRAYTLTLVLNDHRTPNPASELLAIELLLDTGYSEGQICEATGLSRQTVRQRLRLRALVPALRQALDAGQISAQAALEAARLPAEVQDRLAARLHEHGKLRLRDVREARQVASEDLATSLLDDLLAQTATPEPGADPVVAERLRVASALEELARGEITAETVRAFAERLRRGEV